MVYDALISDLLEDPDRVAYLPEARTPEFFAAYITHCRHTVTSDPARGLRKVDIGFRIVTTPCQNARLWGLKAYALRALGDASSALTLLDAAFRIAGSCRLCHGYLLWRRAKVYAALGSHETAFRDTDAAIQLYHDLRGQQDDHDFDANGLANAYLARGDIRVFVGRKLENLVLISEAVEDISKALSLADPRQNSVLFQISLFNLAGALAATGRREDLELADSHIRRARVLFRGPRKEASQERAKLDWLTGMVRHQLGKCAPSRAREMLERALSDFLKLKFFVEATAVASDLTKIHYPDRDPILELTKRLTPEIRRYAGDLADRVHAIFVAANRDVTSFNGGAWTLQAVQQGLKTSIEDLREACGPRMMACLVNWREA